MAITPQDQFPLLTCINMCILSIMICSHLPHQIYILHTFGVLEWVWNIIVDYFWYHKEKDLFLEKFPAFVAACDQNRK